MDEIWTWATALVMSVIAHFHPTGAAHYAGYVEANYVYAAATEPGRLTQILVQEGEAVQAGQILFALDDERQKAALSAARASQASAEANWRNLETGNREQELDVLRAALKQAEANRDLAANTLDRNLTLSERGLVTDAHIDNLRAQLESANAAVAQAEAQLSVGGLPARQAQLEAARANYEAALANTVALEAQLEDRVVEAPVDGVVDRIYFEAGEVVSVGGPVLSIRETGKSKVRLFIPELDRSLFQVGDRFAVSCDNCAEGLSASVSYLAADPQHTPPIIYSREERRRLVFMAEADISDDAGLLPGQPVTLSVLE